MTMSDLIIMLAFGVFIAFANWWYFKQDINELNPLMCAILPVSALIWVIGFIVIIYRFLFG